MRRPLGRKRKQENKILFFIRLPFEVVGLGKAQKLEAASRGLEERERRWSFHTREARVRVEAEVL